MTFPSLIDFWRLIRKHQGNKCEVMPFHHIIADKLTKLVLGQLDAPNLMVLMPPRCGKTDLGIKAFVPWASSYFPDSEFILASYGNTLAVENSISCRNVLSADWYRSIVDSQWGARVQMSGERAGGRQDHFYTHQGGAIKSVGRGSGITGFGAGKLREEFGGCIIIDDLLKANEKNSPAARREAVDYINGTLKSRRNRHDAPATPIVLIMQRLHPEDPAGWLLREERDQWEVLQIPAHDDKAVIWPGRLSLENLRQMEEADPETYWAQYMQEPTQSVNVIFKESWWRYWHNLDAVNSKTTLKFITADTAFKAKDSSDWSVMQCWGCQNTSGIALIDQVRGRWEFPELLQNAKAFWEKHTDRNLSRTPATEFWIEDKASGTSLVQSLRRDVGINARPWEPTDKTSPDKVGRAKQCTFPISTGRVAIPHPFLPGYSWVKGFINEHSAFTHDDSHLFDDQVDTETMAILIWMQRGGGVGMMPTFE